MTSSGPRPPRKQERQLLTRPGRKVQHDRGAWVPPADAQAEPEPPGRLCLGDESSTAQFG